MKIFNNNEAFGLINPKAFFIKNKPCELLISWILKIVNTQLIK
tara:strand:+ start:44 stop:172 length:129 start_codon:yes stop_codon:yes gene_type:complete